VEELGDQVAKIGGYLCRREEGHCVAGRGCGTPWVGLSLLNDLAKKPHDDNAVRNILQHPKRIPSLDWLAEIFMRDYWSRLWVIQEIHFARTIIVQCGSYGMDWIRMLAVQNALVERFKDTLDEVSHIRYTSSSGNVNHIKYLRHAIEFRGPKSLALDRENLSRCPGQIELFGVFDDAPTQENRRSTGQGLRHGWSYKSSGRP
jgi:hypothetical protein